MLQKCWGRTEGLNGSADDPKDVLKVKVAMLVVIGCTDGLSGSVFIFIFYFYFYFFFIGGPGDALKVYVAVLEVLGTYLRSMWQCRWSWGHT